MDDDIVAAVAGKKFDVNDRRRIIRVVVDLDACFRLELFNDIGINVIGPVVNI